MSEEKRASESTDGMLELRTYIVIVFHNNHYNLKKKTAKHRLLSSHEFLEMEGILKSSNIIY